MLLNIMKEQSLTYTKTTLTYVLFYQIYMKQAGDLKMAGNTYTIYVTKSSTCTTTDATVSNLNFIVIKVEQQREGNTYTIYVTKSSTCTTTSATVSTINKNIFASIKMQNNFCYSLKMVIFPILRQQYQTFLYCSPFCYRSSNFAIAKVFAHNLFA